LKKVTPSDEEYPNIDKLLGKEPVSNRTGVNRENLVRTAYGVGLVESNSGWYPYADVMSCFYTVSYLCAEILSTLGTNENATNLNDEDNETPSPRVERIVTNMEILDAQSTTRDM
jgi:hypothetical protein